jgi:hypothetical protein
MGIREFLERLRAKKVKYKEFEEDMDIQEKYYERKKSANQRELEKYENDEYEKAVKERLEQYRKRNKNEMEFGHQILHTKNMFSGEKPVVMKEKKLFSSKSNLNTPGGLFWK